MKLVQIVWFGKDEPQDDEIFLLPTISVSVSENAYFKNRIYWISIGWFRLFFTTSVMFDLKESQ